jgi:AcrR family transcriptional regulator
MPVSSNSTAELDDSPAPQAAAIGSAPARSRSATRERLLHAGESLFAERGIHGVTSHDIARRAGVAAGTFYLHFKDKAELFREIALEAVAELRSRLVRAVESQTAPEAATRAHAAALVGFAEEHRDLIRILFSSDGDAAAIESDVLDQLASTIADARRKRIASGDMQPELDPAVLSQALVGMWARVIAWWAEDPKRAERERVIETLTRIQLSGTNPRSSHPSAGESNSQRA